MLYVAPEVLAGQSPTVASDVYALGVLLYQLTVGDFRKPLAPGWETAIADSLIREDIALAACGDPARRMKTTAELVGAAWSSLDRRRLEAEELAHAQQRAVAAERQRADRWVRRRWLPAAGVTAFLAVMASLIFYRSLSRRRHRPRPWRYFPFRMSRPT